MALRLLLLMLVSTFFRTLAADYEVDGEIVQTIFKRDGGVDSVKRSTFTVFFKDCAWLIETTDHNEAGKALAWSETACTNTTEIYSVGGQANDVGSAGQRGTKGFNFASIVSNNMPVGQTDNYLVCHLWFMFASECYFQNVTTNWITPVYDMNASASVNVNLKRKAKWELINAQDGLPSNVVFYGTIDLSIDATYHATGVMNTGTVQLPSGFVFEQRVGYGFEPGPILEGTSNASYHIRKRAIATVTGVRPVCSRGDFTPTATGTTVVVDQRVPPMVTPPDSTTFSVFQIQNLTRFLSELKSHSDKVSAFLWQESSRADKMLLTNYQPSPQISRQSEDVVQVLNKIIDGPCIYENVRFQGILLRPETSSLLKEQPKGAKLAHLNRLLLEDAFPAELMPAPRPSAYVVQNGVEWLSMEKAREAYMKPPPVVPKRSSKVTIVFYASVLSLSAVFLFLLNRRNPRRV